MSFDDLYDTLSYDEKILGDKLGLAYNNPNISPPAVSMEHRIRNKLRENDIIDNYVRNELREPITYPRGQELMSSQREKQQPQRHVRHSSTCKCNTSNTSNTSNTTNNTDENEDTLNSLFNNNTLTIMVIILALCCIVQYVQQQSMVNSMDQMMKTMCQMASINKPLQQNTPLLNTSTASTSPVEIKSTVL